ncbi:hypothetical protein JW887_00870 [Candidatus Dojkabacteria bacterium]|nr:hypothetical protein [Candidatus Dojkabacteria bacterium]
MIITFLKQEESNVTVKFATKDRKLSKTYINLREKVWERFKSNKKESVWNGEIYTIHKIIQHTNGRLCIEVGLCEYKDIILSRELGDEMIYSRFGSNYIFQHIETVALPRTVSGKYVYGVRNNKTSHREGELDMIGGLVNRDEIKITSFGALKKNIIKEVLEETGIQAQYSEIHLVCVCFFNNKFQFVYTFKIDDVQLNTHSKVEEFSHLVKLSESEILNNSGSSAYEYSKNYLKRI